MVPSAASWGFRHSSTTHSVNLSCLPCELAVCIKEQGQAHSEKTGGPAGRTCSHPWKDSDRDVCQHCFPRTQRGSRCWLHTHGTCDWLVLSPRFYFLIYHRGPVATGSLPVLSPSALVTPAEQRVSQSWQVATACRLGEAKGLSQHPCPKVCWSPHTRPLTPNPEGCRGWGGRAPDGISKQPRPIARKLDGTYRFSGAPTWASPYPENLAGWRYLPEAAIRKTLKV